MNASDVKAVLWNSGECELRSFGDVQAVLSAESRDDVVPLLKEAEEAARGGLHAVGFVAYEAAAAFDPACRTHEPSKLPLAWFALFRSMEALSFDRSVLSSPGPWTPSMDRDEYVAAIGRIRQYLNDGDTYQVNYSYRLRTDFDGDAWALFRGLSGGQRAGYPAFIETADFAICSASPELFFSLDGGELVSRPMKGTADRGLTSEQDQSIRLELEGSEKNRAENVMIVDMVRNDMGRVASPGSVTVESMFDIEKYPTVYQMTSTVSSRTNAPVTDVFRALFPCASITGAPKIRTMEIIRELEKGPRGVYTGTIGHISPGSYACFNVAIRTVVIDKRDSTAEYGVGGGIVWDSDASAEYEECRVKAAVLAPRPGPFELLETMLWDGEDGYFLLDRHLARLEGSARYFDYPLDTSAVRKALMGEGEKMGTGRNRVRLRVDESGRVHMETAVTKPDEEKRLWKVGLAMKPVSVRNRFLYHKTTNRGVYERAREDGKEFDDVLLVNESGELTESTIANVVLEMDGARWTPPVACGLLAGVFRGWLIDRGEVQERVLRADDLRRATAVFLVNSVRKWMRAEVVLPNG
ncbi:MAG: aminodeoxychorismate synthase component I [Lentisphaerae bacterium]|nr:aminodeoxychorismate synthase component I [Lentisphaerota bacterium]